MISDVRTGLYLALKNIFRRRFLFSLIVIIIALGFINMVFFTSFTNGLANAINDGVITMQFGNIVIEPKEGETYINNADSVLRTIQAIPGVISATRRYHLGAVLQNKEKTMASWMFQAIDPEKEQKVTRLQDFLDGEYLSQDDDGIMVGAHIAGSGSAAKFMPIEETLEVTPGDEIKVTYNNGISREYRVKGVIDGRDFHAVMSSYITIKEAEQILGVSNKASMIVVRVDGPEEYFIRKFQELGINDEIRTWDQKAGQANLIVGMFETVNKIFYIVGIIIIFLTIYVATSINVIHRRKQLGILKAIGMKRSTVTLSYIFTAILYWLFGILVATAIIKYITAQLAANPIDTPMGFLYPVLNTDIFWLSVFIALASSVVASVIPVMRETKKNIITLMWK